MNPYTDDDSKALISKELKEKFAKALKGRLKTRTCRDCPQALGFVQVVEFLIDGHLEAVARIDRAAQTMEEFIEIFRELELKEVKARMSQEDGR